MSVLPLLRRRRLGLGFPETLQEISKDVLSWACTAWFEKELPLIDTRGLSRSENKNQMSLYLSIYLSKEEEEEEEDKF